MAKHLPTYYSIFPLHLLHYLRNCHNHTTCTFFSLRIRVVGSASLHSCNVFFLPTDPLYTLITRTSPIAIILQLLTPHTKSSFTINIIMFQYNFGFLSSSIQLQLQLLNIHNKPYLVIQYFFPSLHSNKSYKNLQPHSIHQFILVFFKKNILYWWICIILYIEFTFFGFHRDRRISSWLCVASAV